MIAGASTVGVGTALFYDPLVCKKINAGIAEYLERHSMTLQQLVGSMTHASNIKDSAAAG
jgi:dihydroorotate dehydrogenase (NAD+) catalytic subunit